MQSERFDPVTLHHWMWWRIKCLTASGEEFQKLFEAVAQQGKGRFVGVRPYGNMGDLKCDGFDPSDGTVYQVYSPDEMTQAKARKKMREDLAGAVKHWGAVLKRWVFVHNARRGIAPKILLDLVQEHTSLHPDITIELLSSEDLWDEVRGLPLQLRSEILGAPTGYGDYFLMPSALPEEVQERLCNGLFVFIQDIMSPINALDVGAALQPGLAFGPPFHVRPLSTDVWEIAADVQEQVAIEAIDHSRHLLPRFAVFSLSPIPLAIHLGYLLTDRLEVAPYQYDRDRQTWCWNAEANGDVNFVLTGLPAAEISGQVEVVIRVSLSALIHPAETRQVVGDSPVQIDLRVDNPDEMWLCDPEQLVQLREAFRAVLKAIRHYVPECTCIHLFYAGPTGGAVAIGQTINPLMNAPVALYQYDRGRTPRYEYALQLPRESA
jgi:hypothetical protein